VANLVSVVARVAFDLAFQGLGQAIVVSHPSALKVPDDIEVIFLLIFAISSVHKINNGD
jgi:hypothetical protein